MKILITDGYKKADFLLSQMSGSGHEITFIHDDEAFAQKMLESYGIDTYVGDSSLPQTYQSLDNIEFDAIVCLSNMDHKNYVICKMIPTLLEVNKRITIISNPNNQHNFKKLGIEGTISASHIITNIINKLATVDAAMNYVSINTDSKVRPLEIVIKKHYSKIGSRLMDLTFPESCIVCCIIRGDESVIPNGQDMIYEGDRVVIFTNVLESERVVKVFE